MTVTGPDSYTSSIKQSKSAGNCNPCVQVGAGANISSSGSYTLTATLGASQTGNPNIIMMELSKMPTTLTVDTSSNTGGSFTTAASAATPNNCPALTTAVPNDWIIGGAVIGQTANNNDVLFQVSPYFIAGAGSQTGAGSNAAATADLYDLVSATGTYTPQFLTNATSQGAACASVALKSNAGFVANPTIISGTIGP